MKLLFDNGGQTCNKFWGYLAPIQNALRTGETYIIPFYDIEIDNYPNLRDFKFFNYPFLSKIGHKFFGAKSCQRNVIRVFSNRIYNIVPWFQKKKCSVNGWDKRHCTVDPRLRDKILDIFKPSVNITETVEKEFSLRRSQNNIIIGVHIRRGDYELWREGRYYYSFEEYASFCNMVQNQFKDVKVTFFLASNERIPLDAFSGLDVFTIKNGSAPKDLYGLSQCDYIVGPPSSYSRWASFYGRVPISFIMDRKQLQFNFHTITSYDTYDNGDKVELDM